MIEEVPNFTYLFLTSTRFGTRSKYKKLESAGSTTTDDDDLEHMLRRLSKLEDFNFKRSIDCRCDNNIGDLKSNTYSQLEMSYYIEQSYPRYGSMFL